MTRITPSPGWSAHLKTVHTGWLFFRSSRGSIICVKIPDSLTCCVAFTAKIEDRRSKTEDRRPKIEDRRSKTEDRRPKTEDRRPKTEDRRPKTEDRHYTNLCVLREPILRRGATV